MSISRRSILTASLVILLMITAMMMKSVYTVGADLTQQVPPPLPTITHTTHPPPTTAAPVCPKDFLYLPVYGAGVNNQRESILNAVLLAHLWNLTLVVPGTCCVGYVEARGRNPNTYIAPWTGKRCGGLGLLFDVEHFERTVPVCTAREEELLARPSTASLAPFPADGSKKYSPHPQHNTYAVKALKSWVDRGTSLFSRDDYSVETLHQVGLEMKRSNKNNNNNKDVTMYVSPCLTTIMFSRYWDKCEAFGEKLCHNALRAFRPRAEIESIIQRLLSKIKRPYVLMHMRAFKCKVSPHNFAQYVRHIETKCLAEHATTVYLASDYHEAHHAAIGVTSTNWTTKERLASDSVRWPFEVRSTVDFEMAVRADEFVGWFGDSSFTHYAVQYRRLLGRTSKYPTSRSWCVRSSSGGWLGVPKRDVC
eukprot:PhM_4_TR17045/c0_g1_i1/m.34837